MTSAIQQRAEGILSGTGVGQVTMQKAADTVTSDFLTDTLHYLSYLLDETLRQYGLSLDIVKGLAAFDPFILFKRSTEVALRPFDVLFTTFLLRSWVTRADESVYRDQYLELLDQFRSTHPPSFNLTEDSAI